MSNPGHLTADVDHHEPPLDGALPEGLGAPSLVEAPTLRTEPQRSRAARVAAVVLPPLVLVGACIGIWYYVSLVGLSERRQFLVPPPDEVIADGFLDWDNLSKLLDALWSSVRVAAIGLAISVVIGVALAVAMSQSKLIERAVFPLMVAQQATPILALTPMIALIFGTNQTSRVIVCVMITIFPIVLNTLFGLVSGDPGLHDLITLHHGGRLTRLRKVMFPSALPAMFAGLRISAGLSVVGAIVGDFFFGRGEKGLGQLIRQYASNSNDIPLMYATVIVASALGIAVFLAFGALQHAAIGAWHDSKSGAGR
jgi:NitT/TauT family transport system permease protein